MNKLLAILFWLTATVVIGAGITQKFSTDKLVWGISGSTDDKILEADTGLGVNNPKVTIDVTNDRFSFNKALQVANEFFQMGNGTNVDTTLEVNIGLGATNPKFRWNSTDGRLEFSNDGILFKAIGSGSGSGNGINELPNGGFEDGVTSEWVTSSGTLVELDAVADRALGEKSARFTAAAPGDYYETTPTAFSNLVQDGFGCMADFHYKGGVDFVVKIFKEDLPSNPGIFVELLSETIVSQTAWSKFPTLTFPCAENMKIRFESVAASSIDLDQVYLGSNKNFTEQTSGSRFVGSLTWDNGNFPGCFWASNSTSFVDYPVDTDCQAAARAIVGNVGDVSGGGQPHISADLKPGHYVITYSGEIAENTSTQDSAHSYRVTINSGALNTHIVTKEVIINGANGFVSIPEISFRFDVSTSLENAEIKLQSLTNNTSDGSAIDVSNQDFKISLYYFPSPAQAQTAFTPEQSSFFIDVSIGGANSADGPTTTPVSPSNNNWDMVLNKGSARIPCTSPNPATGLTCSSGNESMGINFNAPVAGVYEACFTFASNSGTSTIFRLAETGNSDVNILQQGTSTLGNSSGSDTPYTLCDYFTLGAGERTIRAFYEAAGTVNIAANRSASLYDRDVNIKVRLANNYVSQPVILNQVSSTNESGIKEFACDFTSAGAIDTSSGLCESWVDSSSMTSGQLNITLKTGTCSQPPVCTCVGHIATGNVGCSRVIAGFTATNIEFTTFITSSGAPVDFGASVRCSCLK